MNRKEHLLVKAAEEANEVGQRITKALSFGLDEIQPEQNLNNAQRIVYEFNDLYAVMEMLLEEGHIPNIIDRTMIEKKKIKVEKYLEYSKQIGTLKEHADIPIPVMHLEVTPFNHFFCAECNKETMPVIKHVFSTNKKNLRQLKKSCHCALCGAEDIS